MICFPVVHLGWFLFGDIKNKAGKNQKNKEHKLYEHTDTGSDPGLVAYQL